MTRTAHQIAAAALAQAVDQVNRYDSLEDALDCCLENAIEDAADWRAVVRIFNQLAREAGHRSE